MLTYIIKSTIYLSVFYLFMTVMMRKTTFFRLNRIILLAGSAICMCLPFLKLPVPAEAMIELNEVVVVSMSLSDWVPSDVMEGSTGINIPLMVYLIGSCVTIVLAGISYYRMLKLIGAIPAQRSDGLKIRIVETELPSFSWGRNIVISRKDYEENPEMLKHETMHVRCSHSIDLLVYTAITVLHWFNPLVWMMRAELKAIHEYEADERTLEGETDTYHYQMLLVKAAVGAKSFIHANGFNHSRLKKRIGMLHTAKTAKRMKMAYLLCIPLLMAAMCCCSESEMKEEPIAFELLYKGIKAHLSSDNETIDATLEDFTISQLKGVIDSSRESTGLSLQTEYDPFTDARTVESLKNAINDINDERPIKAIHFKSTGIPFYEVDEQPTFQGGDANEFSRWVNTQLVYPEEAKAKHAEGHVSTSFTVTEKGKVKDVRIMKGAAPDLDAEALRVVSMSPDWTPGKSKGKPVAVTYIFPIIFKLR